MHGGGSDLNTSSLRSGDKDKERERESPAWVLPKATGGGGGLTGSHLKILVCAC